MISEVEIPNDSFDLNRLQGQYIAKQGWVDRPYLALAYRLVQHQNYDLCELLVQNSILNLAQSQEARQAVQAYSQSNQKEKKKTGTTHLSALNGLREEKVVVSLDPDLVPGEQNTLDTFDVSKTKKTIETQHADHTETLIFTPPSGQFASVEWPSHESYEQLMASGEDTIDVTVAKEKTPRNDSHFFEAGDTFEHYRILKEIARGGMGVVFKAECLKTQQLVAIKFILANDHVESVERFLREIKVLKKARHPCIVQILESGQHGSLFYYTMEYLQGESLVTLAKNAQENGDSEFQQRMLHYLHDIAGALDHCHQNGIIHRDVKPHNIVVDSETDRAVLIDFGIMKRLSFHSYESTDAATLTKTGQFLGSPAFMSPEQYGVVDFGSVTEKSDVWSFGATLFFVLAGRPAFCESNVVRVMESVTLGVIPELKDVQPDVRPEINELCRSCMERSQALRPTMAELRVRLGEVIATEDHSIKLKLIALFVGLAILGNLIGLMLFARNPVKIMAVDAPKLTNKLKVPIQGEVNEANARIQVSRMEGGQTIVLETVSADKDGLFSCNVAVLEGDNRISVSTPEYESGVPWVVSIYCDATQPGFSFPRHKTEGSLLVVDESLLLYGQVNEDRLSTLTITGKEVPCQNGGEFEFLVEDKSEVQRLTLTATDHAGNQGRKTIAVLTPKAVKAREKKEEKVTAPKESPQRRVSLADWNTENAHWTYSTSYYFKLRTQYLTRQLTLTKPRRPKLEDALRPDMSKSEKTLAKLTWYLLSDLKLWQRATPESQDLAIKYVGRKIEGDFVFKETQKYSIGDKSCRVATFKHRLTGIEFNLIPGGSQKIAPRVIEVEDFLELIAGKTGDLSHVCDILKIVPQTMLVSFGFYRAFQLNEKKTVGELIAKILETKDALAIVKTLGESWKNGNSSGRSNQGRQSKIVLPEMVVGPLLVSRFEISEEEWSQSSPSDIAKGFPKVSVSVSDIDAWFSRVSGALKLRLPSRWEWTHACLGDSEKSYFWDGAESDAERFCWLLDNSKQYLHNRDDLKDPNLFGLYNTLGNAEEWCVSIWRGVVNKRRQSLWPVAVGGHYNSTDITMRASFFRYAGLNQRSRYCGFRAVVDLP